MREEARDRWKRLELGLGEIRKELEEIRGREERWRMEKELVGRIEELDRKWDKKGGEMRGEMNRELEELWERVRRVEEGKEKGEEKEVGGDLGKVEKKLREMEWGWEKREREERKRNIIVRGMEAEEGREEGSKGIM